MNVGALDLEFEPVGNVVTTALNFTNKTTINNAEKVLVANGNEKSKKIFIYNECFQSIKNKNINIYYAGCTQKLKL